MNFFIETEVSDWNLDFQDKAFKGSDRNEFRVFPRLGVNVGANTQALVEYGFTNLNYEVEDRSGTSNELSVGVRGLLGEYLSYQAWGGFEVRTYDQDSRNRYAGFIGRGELVYQPSDFTRIALEAHRRVVESVSQSQSYYVNNEVSLKLRRQLMEKLYANARGTMRLNNYDTERDDFYIEPAVGLEYILPYTDNIASIFGEYRWRVRESDTSNNDYHGQLIDMGVKAEF